LLALKKYTRQCSPCWSPLWKH